MAAVCQLTLMCIELCALAKYRLLLAQGRKAIQLANAIGPAADYFTLPLASWTWQTRLNVFRIRLYKLSWNSEAFGSKRKVEMSYL